MPHKYSLGLDFGTNSVRALIVAVADGREIGTAVYEYTHGQAGIILDPNDPLLARQHPQEYVDGIAACVPAALADAAASCAEFRAGDIIGIGVDATASTPIPVDGHCRPLAFRDEFSDNPNALAWLWKDHTSIVEAAEITEAAEEHHPEYLAKCGGTYSCEWYWSKILHCLRVDAAVAEAAADWIECTDWVPALLTGITDPAEVKRGACAAGHKGMYNPEWGGFPDVGFLDKIDPGLAAVRRGLPKKAHTIAATAGKLSQPWADKLGLPGGIPVAVGAIDAHVGAVACGIQPGVLIRVLGTSSCDMMVAPLEQDLPDIPGLCGVAAGTILPGAWGLEAGQAAVGDIFNWFVGVIQPGGPDKASHEALSEAAAALRPGQSGLLGLDWFNGNRTVLIDQRLTGALLGLTLHTTPAEIYRALIECSAFGARMIIDRFEKYKVDIDRIITCGGIAAKNPLLMRIYANATGRPIEVSRSEQTCALGSAMAGAVVGGGHNDFAAAQTAMTGVREEKFVPDEEYRQTYDRLYSLFRRMHDLFGARDYVANQFDVMKQLLAIRDDA